MHGMRTVYRLDSSLRVPQKSQISPFWLKISTQSILRMLILIPKLVFSVFNPKSIFGQTWAENT